MDLTRLPNFFIKHFKTLHKPMAQAYSEIIKDLKQTPDWLVEGATNLLPKKEETWIPKIYRPIACLPTTFKVLPSVITDRLYSQLEKKAIMTPEQRGGKKDYYGCRDQLMINNAILENCKKRKNLSTAWIDYKKAFDSVPHSWILKMPPDVEDSPSTYNIHRRMHEPMEDQHDTSPQGRSSRDRTNKNQERDIPR